MSRIDEAFRRADLVAGGSNASAPTAHVPTAASALEDYPAEPLPLPIAGHRRTAIVATPFPVEKRTETAPVPEVVTVPARVDLPARPVDSHLVVGPDASPICIEQYRRLAATLYQAQIESGIKTIMVSSALPREGKTLTVANLALTLAHSYMQRVLVIDADLRNPSLHDVLNVPNKFGLGDYLRTADAALPIISVSPTLSMICGGPLNINPIGELVSDRMKQLVESAASRFDWVLLDTPPVGLLPDAHLLARFSDAVVFVVAASSSPYSVVQRALAEVGSDRVIGVVLNRAAAAALPNSSHYDQYSRRRGDSPVAGLKHG